MFTRKSLNILILLICFLTTPKALWSQTAHDVFPAVVFLQGHHGVKKSTINGREVEIWVKNDTQKNPVPLNLSASGTGFIVSDGPKLYLVTADHVANGIHFEAKATLYGHNDEPLTYDLSELTGTQAPKWTSHKEADVAVLPISPPENFRAAIRAVPYEQLATKNIAPNLDIFLTTVGFPLKLGVKDKFSPIVKVSHSASALFRYPRFDNKVEATFFILDDPSVAGFSGAPVFKLPFVRVGAMSSGQGAFECVGIVHGTFNDPTGGKFAAILPAFYITETISKVSGK